MAEIWHRYEDVRYASSSYDETGEPIGRGELRVEHRTYKVVKETPCGVRLDNGRFVNRSSRKMWACPTEKAAMESFIARKTRQARILHSQLNDVETALWIARGRHD